MKFQKRQRTIHPYPGLRPFEDAEHDIFYGRGKQIDEIIARLRQHHFAAIVGGSGCGKSSLVRAGVLPELRFKGIEEREDTWQWVTFTPGKAPIENLKTALNDLLVETESEDDKQRRRQEIDRVLRLPEGLSRFLNSFRDQLRIRDELQANANLLVLVDQFEEVFRSADQGRDQVEHLVALIVDAYNRPDDQLFVILTMRSEDLHRCAGFLELPDILNSVAYLTRRLDERELQQAIIFPGQRFSPVKRLKGAREDHEGVVDSWPYDEPVMERLFASVKSQKDDPDHLPLLQHFLCRLWEQANRRWKVEGKLDSFLITLSDLEAAAGNGHPDEPSILKRSVANHADALYQELSTEQRRIAETMFRLLAEVDDNGVYKRRWTTRRIIADVSGADPKDVDTVVDQFSTSHSYVRYDGNGPDDDIDVSHEAFIRNWPRFREWLEDERETARIYERLLQRLREIDPKPTGDALEITSAQRLDDRFLALVRDRMKIEQCDHRWAKRYNAVISKYFNENLSEKDFSNIYDAACDYYKQSLKLHEKEIEDDKNREIREVELEQTAKREALKAKYKEKQFTVFAILGSVILALGAIVGWFLWTEGDYAKLETMAFQPYAVASALTGSVDQLPEDLKVGRLWEAAVALRAINELEVQSGKFDLGASERRLRLERASRLAYELTNFKVRRLLPSVPWRIVTEDQDGGSQSNGNNPSTNGFMPVTAENDPARCWLRIHRLVVGDQDGPSQGEPTSDISSADADENKKPLDAAYENFRIAGGVDPTTAPAYRIFYDKKSAVVALAIVDKNPELCQPIYVFAVPQNAALFADPALRLLAFVNTTPDPGQPAYPFTAELFRLHWYNYCPDTQDGRMRVGCTPEWRVFLESLSRMEFATAHTFEFEQGGKSFVVRDPENSESPARYDVNWYDTLVPSADDKVLTFPSVDDRPEFNCNKPDKNGHADLKNFYLCPEKKKIFQLKEGDGILNTFTSAGEYLALVVDREGELRGEHIILVYNFGDKSSNQEKSFWAMKHPIASIEYFGPPAKQISFGKGSDGNHDGRLYVLDENGDRYVAWWSARALREAVCRTLLRAGVTTEPSLDQATPTYQLLEKHETGVIKKFEKNPCDDFDFWPKSG